MTSPRSEGPLKPRKNPTERPGMTHAEQSVEVHLNPELLRIFFPLLQEGVELQVEVGCTVKELLVEQFGISVDYLSNRITTIFLNSKAVDQAATAVIHEGAVLALSGAMPGLVGATLRSGGYYAAMRGAMTYTDAAGEATAKSGRIKFKLFNLLLEELGPRVLRLGILLNGARFKNFMGAQPAELRFRDCRVDGRPATTELLRNAKFLENDETMLKLVVHFGDETGC